MIFSIIVHSKAIEKQNLKNKKSVFPMKDRFYRKQYQRPYQWAYTREV